MSSLNLPALLATWAREEPDAPLVTEGNQTLVTSEVFAHFQRLRCHLSGLPHGSLVAYFGAKSQLSLPALLAIWASGCGYVPLDPAHPLPRLRQILEIAQPSLILVDPAAMRGSANEAMAGHTTLSLWEPATTEPATPLMAPVVGEAIGAVLFTSGTTGVPKGVQIPHRAIDAFLRWAEEVLECRGGECIASLAPLGFDLSILDLFLPLVVRARLLLVDPSALLRPEQLVKRFASEGVTQLYTVPTTVRRLVVDGQLNAGLVPSLRRVLYAGEPFPVPALRRAMAALPQVAFHNWFGPTESNVIVAHRFDGPPGEGSSAAPIGHPCTHATLRLVTETGEPAAEGALGELWVSGPTVMAGYLRRPDLTESVLVEREGRTWLRTGDWVRRDGAGVLWFHGRRDRLVKRRGVRLELGEIEATLRGLPSVTDCAVVVDQEGEDCRVIAHLVLSDQDPDLVALRMELAAQLPAPLLPDELRPCTALPLTATGKIDYQALA